MKIYITDQMQEVEQNMIEHFEEHGIDYDSIYLTEKDYFPQHPDEFLDTDFVKWFYYFQGQYHKLQDILKFLNS